MGFTTQVLTGVAQLLDAESDAVWLTPPAVYDETDIGIVFGVPTQSPRSLIALAVYGNTDDPAASDSTMQLQVRLRAADPTSVDDLADAVFDALQGLRANLNGVRLVYGRRTSTLPLGIDGTGRAERSDNYDLMVHRPSTHRE